MPASTDKKDKAEDPEKFMQDQEIVRWAYQDTYRDRTVDHHHKALEDMDSRLCGKWPILKDLLKKWHDKGDKVLLFSRSTRLLDALTWWIEAGSCNLLSSSR
jgi:SNF2 family DNA or RNA helicase